MAARVRLQFFSRLWSRVPLATIDVRKTREPPVKPAVYGFVYGATSLSLEAENLTQRCESNFKIFVTSLWCVDLIEIIFLSQDSFCDK